MIKMNRQYILGNRWVICDICDFGYRFSQMRKGISGSQKGYDVCPDCFDPEHERDTYVVPHRTEGILEEVS